MVTPARGKTGASKSVENKGRRTRGPQVRPVPTLGKLWCSFDQTFRGDVGAADGPHRDVPALLFWCVRRGQVTHAGLPGLRVGRGRTHYEGTLERVDRDPRI